MGLAGGFVDGAIVVSARDDDPISRAIEQYRVPAVFIGDVEDVVPASSVRIDNRAASAAIAKKLVSTGRSRIGMIAAALGRAAGADRLAGFIDAVGDRFDPTLVARVDLFTYADGKAGMRTLLERDPLIDGVVASSDAVAAGAMSVLQEHRRSVPDDVGIVGFDDSSWAAQVEPQLSTVHQPAFEMGATAGRLLLDQMVTGAEPSSVVLETPIVWRGSA